MKSYKGNPLAEYAKQNNKTLWKISQETGIPVPSLYHFVQHSPKEMEICRLKTAIVFKQKLGIDLLKYLINN